MEVTVLSLVLILVAAVLMVIGAWLTRRANVALLPKPKAASWPDDSSEPSVSFRGSTRPPATTEEEPDRTAPHVRPAEESPRFQVPGYEILSELGRGGMGVVYEAFEPARDRLVALKRIRGRPSRTSVDWFRAEALKLTRARHPNVVEIYDVYHDERGLFFTMEFCRGGGLNKLLARRARLGWRETAELVARVAHGAEHAHRNGIIHRDLKPANVLLTAEGTPKISDFGIAGGLDDELASLPDPCATMCPDVVGTPGYAAPEQWGNSHEAGPAADVYSLGVILYECLTGRLPFGAGFTWMDRRSVPVSPETIEPTVPHELAAVCLRCLQIDPAGRYASARALACDLEELAGGQGQTRSETR